jgi:hypothetical protein
MVVAVCLVSESMLKATNIKFSNHLYFFFSPENSSVQSNNSDFEETTTRNSVEASTRDWCFESVPYFSDHDQILVGDFKGCCLCTQTYLYGCESCRDVIFPKLFFFSFIIFMLMKQI